MYLTKKSRHIQKLSDRFYPKLHIPLEIITDVFAAFLAVKFFFFFGIIPAALLVLAASGVQIFRLQKNIADCPKIVHFLSAAAAIAAGIYLLIKAPLKWSFIFDMIVIYIGCTSILGKALPNIPKNRKKLRSAILASSALSFILTIYLATDTFVNNFSDFNFFYQQLLPALLIDFAVTTAIITLVLLCQKDTHFDIGINIVTGLILAVYAQYMFMNSRLDRLGMQEYNWKGQAGFAVVNGLIWIALLAVPFLLHRFRKDIWNKVSTIVPAAMLALHVMTTVTMVATTKNDIFGRNNHAYMTTDEMYTVSKHKNVIVLVFDAADNKYLEEIVSDSPEKLQGFEDFTLYTNTCSVYDFTTMSFAEMFGGVGFEPSLSGDEFFEKAWHSPKAESFYNGLHDMNYQVNAFNMSGGTPLIWNGIFDNAAYSDEPVKMEVERFYYKRLRKSLHSLELYRALPFAAKQCISDEDMSFENIVIFHYGYKNYENKDFLNDMELETADNDKNYFIIQHTDGTHYPCDTTDELDTCFDIARNYIDKLREIGAYDESTIVITSDHGEHSDGEYSATPIFMIKEPNTSHDEMQFSSAPIYSEDFLSTFAINAGFDRETAEKEFGSSIYDFDENSVRERSWYDRMEDTDYPKSKIYGNQNYRSTYNTFYEYSYTGDSKTLDDMVINGDITEIFPIDEFIQ